MPYEKFRILESTGVPLEIENVDTDQIIPARFLKATERIDFDKNLFRDWRYNQDNTLKKDFVLNNKTILEKYLLQEKILVQDLLENTLFGQFMIMDFDVLSQVFLLTFLKIIA